MIMNLYNTQGVIVYASFISKIVRFIPLLGKHIFSIYFETEANIRWSLSLWVDQILYNNMMTEKWGSDKMDLFPINLSNFSNS